jgi:hypothetical protein
MSSTYSPDLRIELIGTGDQAGVWGATTNTNLGGLLESSIAGYTSVSVIAANQAFTANNGAADEARFAAIALTTTTGANFAVYAAPASKLYVIYNASAYTATVYNSTVLGNTTAAGTGVAIPTGKTMTIWSDGTNFAQQNTHLISPTIASPTLTAPVLGTPASGTMTNVTGLPLTTAVTGILPTGNGGTGTTSTTGTGANVFATSPTITSPTLVTPALGTPTSGVMTSVTGLPLTTGVTGILPIANGGVGTASFTGTGNNVFSNSPTLVTPALGTPSSGTLTNCSFPTLNQNTTGTAAGLSATLAVASGGTASTTASGARTNLGLAIGSDIPSLTGTGASGTWGINVSGNAATATTAAACSGNSATATTAANGGVTSVNSATGAVNLGSLAAFGNSLTTNGYQNLPGGLLIQWGTFTGTAVTFPIAFPNAVFSVVASSSTNDARGAANSVVNITLTTCDIYTFANLGGRFIAIGY